MIDLNNPKAAIYKVPYDIVIVAGQSNAVGCGRGEADYSPNDCVAEVYKCEKHNQRKARMFTPRRQFVYSNAKLRRQGMNGFCLYFGEFYCKELLQEGRKLLLVRGAVGGTGFIDGCWGLSDHLYRNTVAMAQRLLNGNADNRLAAILWHQGESDVLGGATKQYYKDKFKALIENLRADLNAPHVPFVAGDMVNEWCATQPNACGVREATAEVVAELNDCALVDSSGLRGNGGEDIIHFSGAANKVLGARYYEEFRRLINLDTK